MEVPARAAYLSPGHGTVNVIGHSFPSAAPPGSTKVHGRLVAEIAEERDIITASDGCDRQNSPGRSWAGIMRLGLCVIVIGLVAGGGKEQDALCSARLMVSESLGVAAATPAVAHDLAPLAMA